MIAYLARTLPLVLRARAGRDGRTVSRIRRRVSLREVDLNLHMNQAAYAEVLELGRTDWFLRSGAWDRWREARLETVVAEQHIVYRRELKPLAAYEIDTRAVEVQGRLLSLVGHVLVGDRVHTRAEVKLLFVGPRGVLAPDEVRTLAEGFLAPALPVADWRVVGDPLAAPPEPVRGGAAG